MLVLSRRKNEDVVIRVDGQIVCTVRINGVDTQGHCKLGFLARDADVMINRLEIDKVIFPNEYATDSTSS